MRRYFKSLKPILWVVALGFVVARIADAHVHLCFDGQEPRSSLHVSDLGVVCHTAQEPSSPHEDDDVDISVFGALLAKKDAQDQSVEPTVFADVVLALVAPPANSLAPFSGPDLPAYSRPHLDQPRLRGPPL